uniref:Uncharacterized protein n=1 Tax=Anguilla anguilla TaxID=7936 RepID=A0A0E9QRP5_ANGAN
MTSRFQLFIQIKRFLFQALNATYSWVNIIVLLLSINNQQKC